MSRILNYLQTRLAERVGTAQQLKKMRPSSVVEVLMNRVYSSLVQLSQEIAPFQLKLN